MCGIAGLISKFRVDEIAVARLVQPILTAVRTITGFGSTPTRGLAWGIVASRLSICLRRVTNRCFPPMVGLSLT